MATTLAVLSIITGLTAMFGGVGGLLVAAVNHAQRAYEASLVFWCVGIVLVLVGMGIR